MEDSRPVSPPDGQAIITRERGARGGGVREISRSSSPPPPPPPPQQQQRLDSDPDSSRNVKNPLADRPHSRSTHTSDLDPHLSPAATLVTDPVVTTPRLVVPDVSVDPPSPEVAALEAHVTSVPELNPRDQETSYRILDLPGILSRSFRLIHTHAYMYKRAYIYIYINIYIYIYNNILIKGK